MVGDVDETRALKPLTLMAVAGALFSLIKVRCNMRKRWFLVGMIFLLVPWLLVGCGISEEVHNAVVAERVYVKAELESTRSELNAVKSELESVQKELAITRAELELVKAQPLPAPPPLPAPAPTPPPLVVPPPPDTGDFEPLVITGSGDKTSRPFTVTTEEWVIDWSYVPDPKYPEMAVFGFFVYPRGETLFFVESVLFPEGTSGSTYSYAGEGEYYIKITAGNVKSWEVVISPP